MIKEILDLIHPGDILLEEFLEPLGLSQYRLATLREPVAQSAIAPLRWAPGDPEDPQSSPERGVPKGNGPLVLPHRAMVPGRRTALEGLSR